MITHIYKEDAPIKRLYRGDTLLYQLDDEPTVIQPGLMVHYDFKDITNTTPNNTTVRDLSGNNNHSLFLNANFTATSGYNNGLAMDGVDDMVKGTNLKGLPVGNQPFTIEVRSTVPPNLPYNRYLTILSLGISNGSTMPYFALETREYSPYLMYVARFVGDENILSGVPRVQPGVQTHVTLAYHGNRQMDWYVNGVAYGTLTMKGDFAIPANAPLYLGVDEGVYAEHRQHTFHSVRIYNRALTPAEADHNYQHDERRWKA